MYIGFGPQDSFMLSSLDDLKKQKTKEHSRCPSYERYTLVHRSKLSCFLVFMHVCILQITSMHKCIGPDEGLQGCFLIFRIFEVFP